MRFEKIWIEQCKATRVIRRRFGVKSALDYLVGEKLVRFAQERDRCPEFAREFPRFLANGVAGVQSVRACRICGFAETVRQIETGAVALSALNTLYHYSRSGRSSRATRSRMDRPCPGVRSIRPLVSRAMTIWCTDGGLTRKNLCMSASAGGRPLTLL